MADNCFQVWHCSVNEFVLLCGRLTVSFLSFIFLSFCTHKHTRALFDLAPLCFRAIWPPYLPSPWLSLFFLSLNLFLPCRILRRGCFFTSVLYLFLLVFVKIFTQGAHNTRAPHYSQQIVYLDLRSLIQLCSSVTFQRHPQRSEALTKRC